MKFRSRSLWRLVFTLLLAWGIAASGILSERGLQAQEDAAVKDEAAAADEDLFKVPDGDAKEIQKFMKTLAQTEPEGETDEEQLAFSIKALTTLVEAADKLLAAKPDDEQAAEGFGFKLEALQALVAMGQDEAREALEKTMAEARSDKRDAIAGMGWQAYISQRSNNWRELSDDEKAEFQQEIIKQIEAEGPKPLDASIVQVTAMGLDGQDDEFVTKLLEESLPIFAKSDNEKVKESLEEANLEGMLRRLKLPGNEMEISGELLGGGEVNWKSYRGKVVLVDFWASWCGPCLAEAPNVLEMYRAYHDKGFDVLGVSLDRTPEEAKEKIKELGLPWDSLYPKKKSDRYWNHPLAKYYGIGGIPTAILVGKDGRVVHMNARGPLLRKELKKLLGEPAKPLETDEAATEETEAEPAEAS
jgi:thiol-disulfide isomerase/thioredoxin